MSDTKHTKLPWTVEEGTTAMITSTQLDNWRDRCEQAEAEVDRLMGVVERDRTKTAESISTLRGIVAGRSWLGEGRGSYEWDDDKYQEEFRGMIAEFMSALDPLRSLAADWSDCPKDFHTARVDWKARTDALAGELADAKRHAEHIELALREHGRPKQAIGEMAAALVARISAALQSSMNKMRAQSPRFSHGVKRALFAPCK
jgi:alkanesulfonate monooxygenase SsuD/methylene tetrahydromethanopterin reductase-like flavin-dependent oxidoreductase (luciferase family)